VAGPASQHQAPGQARAVPAGASTGSSPGWAWEPRGFVLDKELQGIMDVADGTAPHHTLLDSWALLYACKVRAGTGRGQPVHGGVEPRACSSVTCKGDVTCRLWAWRSAVRAVDDPGARSTCNCGEVAG